MTSLALLCGCILPVILVVCAVGAGFRGVDALGAVAKGAKSGMKTAAGIFPSLLGLLVAVYMLRACGILDIFADIAGRLLGSVGIPGELAPLLLIRPFSGSGALATGAELMEAAGPDSLCGRIAAVMLGSSETTLYTANICLSAAGVKKSRYALFAALITELSAAAASSVLCLLFWG
ncbi:MAG: spore maturation protein [Clostridia bacterium]|nr:spore maturation protein [Clostridia bacterium]